MAKSMDEKVTRICVVKDPTLVALSILNDVASRLGHLRSDVWNQYGSLKAWNVSKIQIDPIHRASHPKKYGIPAKLWEATFYDCIDNIHAVQSASIVLALGGLGLNPKSVEGKRVKKILSSRDWFEYPTNANHEELRELKTLHRRMRKHYKRGHTYKQNQIVLKQYKSFVDLDGVVVIEFGYAKNHAKKGADLKLTLKTTAKQPLSGQIRVLIRGDKVEVHKPESSDLIKESEKLSLNKETATIPKSKVIGIDRGYSEVYATSSGQLLGQDFGKMQSSETDLRTNKGRKRNKLRAVASQALRSGDNAKHDRILVNNLGKKKWDKREFAFKGRIKTYVYTVTIQLLADAGKVIYEDLSTPIKGGNKKFSKRNRNKLNQYTKSVVVKALQTVPQRFGKESVAVNAAYTSQCDAFLNLLLGRREGDRFYQFWGGVVQSDINAGRNVLSREKDTEISVVTSHKDVLRILTERTVKYLVAIVRDGLMSLSQIEITDLIRADVKKVFFKVWADLQSGANTGMGSPKTPDSKNPAKKRGRKGELSSRLNLSSLGEPSQVNA